MVLRIEHGTRSVFKPIKSASRSCTAKRETCMSIVDDREMTSSQRAALNDFAWVESVPVRHLSMLEVQHF